MRLNPAFTLSLALAALTGAALAQGDEIAVTPQKASEVPVEPADDKLEIHGQVTALIGSDGTRAVAGTVVIPLGEKGSLALSGDFGRYGAGTAPLGYLPPGFVPGPYGAPATDLGPCRRFPQGPGPQPPPPANCQH